MLNLSKKERFFRTRLDYHIAGVTKNIRLTVQKEVDADREVNKRECAMGEMGNSV